MYLQQKGIGLIEVMVALLLLVIAILGFSALQMRAVQSTDESLLRSTSTNTVSSLAEAMRENIDYLPQMKDVLNGTEFKKNCLDIKSKNGVICSKEEMAKHTAQQLKEQANEEGYKVSMIDCPGTKSGTPINCIILAWKDTNATQGNGNNDCIDNDGIYKSNATCLLMEAY